MGDHSSISITVLTQALEAKRIQIRACQADAEELERAIRQLCGVPEPEPEQCRQELFIDGTTAEVLLIGQSEAVANNEKYPALRFEGMSRIEIAIDLARGFDGYLTVGAFRKVLSKPGVLRSTSQVGSVASRVLKNSTEFVRLWEGVYRLKGYPTNGKSSVQGEAQ